ncbi:MAG: hypothetical protein WD649_01000 [Thermoleophilaceae bacterium]
MTDSKRRGKPDYAHEREEMAKRPERPTTGQAPWRNTHPRSNQEAHGDDLHRSVEKLRALIGN